MIARTWIWGMEGDSLAWCLPSTGKGVDAWKPECSRTLTAGPSSWSDTWTLAFFPQLCGYFLSSRLHCGSLFLFPLGAVLKINEDEVLPRETASLLSRLQPVCSPSLRPRPRVQLFPEWGPWVPAGPQCRLFSQWDRLMSLGISIGSTHWWYKSNAIVILKEIKYKYLRKNLCFNF